MKSILMSIRPQWCEKIVNGQKTIEVRKSAPKETPFKAYIYETKGTTETPWVDEDGHFIYKGRGQVIGEFVCNKVERFSVGSLRSDDIEKLACLSYNEMINYFYKPEELDGNTAKQGYALHITDLKIYDKPKELSEFVSVHEKDFCDECGVAWESWNGDYHCTQKYCDGYHISRPPRNYIYVQDLGE